MRLILILIKTVNFGMFCFIGIFLGHSIQRLTGKGILNTYEQSDQM